MSSIEQNYTRFSDISKLDGMPVFGLKWESLEIETIDSHGVKKVRFYDETLKIETQDAHNRLVTVLTTPRKKQHLLSFKSLTLSPEIENINIGALFRFCPLITHLIIGSNQTVSITTLIKQTKLTILHINESKIYWDPQEKQALLSQECRKNLEIFVHNNAYRFNYPSRFCFRISFVMMNILLLLSITSITSINLNHQRQNGWSLPHFFTYKSMIPLAMIGISLMVQAHLYLQKTQKRKDESLERIRQHNKV